MNKKQIATVLTYEQYAKLDAYCKEKGIKKSSLQRELIINVINAWRPELPPLN